MVQFILFQEQNEENYISGFGMEFEEENDDSSIEYFVKHSLANSIGRPSTLIGANYKHMCYGENLRFCFGISGGIISGYEEKGFIPVVTLYNEFGYKNFSIEVYILPTKDPEIIYDAKFGFDVYKEDSKDNEKWKVKVETNSEARSNISFSVIKDF